VVVFIKFWINRSCNHIYKYFNTYFPSIVQWGRRGSDRMAIGFITTYAISASHN